MYKSLTSWVRGMICCVAAVSSYAATVEVGSIGGQRMVKTTMELAGANTEVRSIALGPLPNSLFLLVASRPEGEGHLAARLSIALSDGAGNIRTGLLPSSFGGSAPDVIQGQPSTLTFLATDVAGLPHLLTMAMNGDIQLHRLAADSSIAQSMTVAIKLSSLSIRRFDAIGPNRFQVVGASGSKPVVIQMDGTGKVLQQLVVPDEGAVVAASPGPNAETTVLVEVPNINNPRFWLGRVQSDGSIVARAEMEGRPLALEAGKQGSSVVLIEQAGVVHRDIVAKGFDGKFKQQWSRSVVTGQASTSRFKLSGLQDGGFLLVGKRDRGLWLSRIDDSGKEIWVSWTDPRKVADLEMTVDVDLAVRGNNIAVAYTALIVRDRRQFSTVRTMQFKID